MWAASFKKNDRSQPLKWHSNKNLINQLGITGGKGGQDFFHLSEGGLAFSGGVKHFFSTFLGWPQLADKVFIAMPLKGSLKNTHEWGETHSKHIKHFPFIGGMSDT